MENYEKKSKVYMKMNKKIINLLQKADLNKKKVENYKLKKLQEFVKTIH